MGRSLFWNKLAGLVTVCLVLVSCGGGGGSPGYNLNTKDLSVGGVASITVLPGESKRLPLSGGVPPYRAVSAESAVAVAAIDGSSLVIGGIAPGASTNVVVTDRAGASQTVAVTVGSSVPLYTTAPAALTIGVGPSQARTFRVVGGVKPYTITGSAPLVAMVTQLNAEEWSIQGVAIGDMKVRIRDAAGKELEVAVTVGSPELRISSDSLTLPIGIPATVVLSGGQKPYRLADGIPAAIQVRLLPGSDSEFEILGLLATGDVDVVFADASGKTVKTKVTINTATTQISVSPSVITVPEASGTAVKFLVRTGARGNLTVLSSNPSLVAISNVVAPSFNSDGTLREFGSFVGTVGAGACVSADTSVELTAIDANGSVGKATVQVADRGDVCGEVPPTPDPNFAIQGPSSVDLIAGNGVSYGITGGTLPLVAVSSNPSVVTAQITGSGRTLQINALAAGSAQVTVFDATGRSAGPITVNVASAGGGAVALNVAPSSATGTVGDQLQFIVRGGTAPYTLTVNNPSVASVSPATVTTDGGLFTATLLNAGSTVVTIRDAAGASTTLDLTVDSTTPGLRLSPSALSIAERTAGGTLDFTVYIYGGVGPYRVFSSDTTLIQVGDGTTFGNNTPIPAAAVAPTSFILRQLQQDVGQDVEVTITVIDANGASATSAVTVKNNN